MTSLLYDWTRKGHAERNPVADKRLFGQITRLPSGRYRARYADPDKRRTASGEPIRHNAPTTFETRQDAEAWLTDERRLISAGTWTSPADRQYNRATKPLTFGEYAELWLTGRKVRGHALADRTRDHYRALLDSHILPTFGETPLVSIQPEMIDHWYERTLIDRPTMRAHAYSLLRTILGTAVDRNLIVVANPAKIRGAGNVERAHQTKTASLEEVQVIVNEMPERRRLMILLAAWCALRFGELAELRRGDVDTKAGVLRIRRGVVRVKATDADGNVRHVRKVKAPKSAAGARDVAIPPHLLPLVRDHLLQHTAPGRDGLLFPGQDGAHLSTSAFYGRVAEFNKAGELKRKGHGYYEARRAANRTDLRFHDLRHTAAVLAAQTGATLADLMSRLGHTTPAAAMRYQSTAAERDQEIARRLSELVKGSES